MRKFGTLILCLAVAFSASAISSVRAEDHIVKISSDPWEPWVFGEVGAEPTGGLAVDVTRAVFKRLELDYEIKIYPYERCIRQMKAGERDVLLMVKKTPEREAFMLFSDVASTDPQLIYYATEHMAGFQWNDWADLKNYKVGVVNGFNYGEFDAAAKNHGINVESTASDNQNIKKLLSGRLNFIILNRSTANYYLEKNPEARGKIKAAAKNISNAEFHFGLSKSGKATAYLDQINAALRAMKSDGSLDKILHKYE